MSALWMVLLIMIYGVELMIAFIQAYIFTLLSAVYINGAESTEE
jgi:F-type H+-transporting ATPase subunit a